MRTPLILLALAACAALAGCGKTSALARPEPMFGEPTPPGPVTTTRQEAAARARADVARLHLRPGAPQSVLELREFNTPSRRGEPVIGGGATAATPGPQGSSSDPTAPPSTPPQ